jgi:Response regulator containing CheY-like receiver domain and AraC-type DNA-binding domain
MIKLLVVDDEQATRDGLIHCVPWSEIDVEVVGEVEDGFLALDLASRTRPDIILTDVKMPRMNGIELAKHIKNELPFCKVIFLSGYSDKEYLKSAIQLQAVDYIEKPVNIEEVKRVIWKTVAICHAEQDQALHECQLRLKASESFFFLKEKLLLEMIHSFEFAPDLRKRFLELGLGFPVNLPVAVTIIALHPVDHQSNLDIQLHRNLIIQKIEQAFTLDSLTCIAGFQDNNSLVLLIYGNRLGSLRIKNILENTLADIEQLGANFCRKFTGIGKIVTGIININESYRTAGFVIQKQFFTGYDQIQLFQSSDGRSYQFDSHQIKQFRELINSDNSAETVAFVNQTVESIKQCEATPVSLIKNFFLQMVLALSKIAEERDLLIGEPAKQFSWNTISESNTLQEIRDYLLQEIKQFFQVQADQGHKSNVVYNIFKYVQQNYQSKNLSIKDIAVKLYLTPNYLCLLFKKETGKTINQYITEIRVEKAKEFLKDPRIKLYEVAEMVGYSDPNYFSKIFKKRIHLNPSDFREKNCS